MTASSRAAIPAPNDLTGFRQNAATSADGTFTFTNVPYNPYEVHADVQAAAAHREVDAHSAVPIDVTMQLNVPTVSESIN